MKKVLNISLILKIISVFIFIGLVVFQNPIMDKLGYWDFLLGEYYRNNPSFYIPTALMVIYAISLFIFLISYLLVKKGMLLNSTKKYEIIAIAIVIISAFVLFVVARITIQFDYVNGHMRENPIIYRAVYIYRFSSFLDLASILHIILFCIAAGMSLGKKKKNNEIEEN